MHSRKAIQIIIPDPCNQKWEEMNMREGERYCIHCQKTVIDFTGYSDKALHDFFTRHENERVCGRFLGSQLNRQIQLPYQPHSRLYRIAVALGLVLSFSQIPDIQARWNVPFVTENSLVDMEKFEDGENLDGDSLVVRGRVLDETGEPVYGAIVEALLDTNIIGGVATNEDGSYKIEFRNEEIKKISIRARYTGYYEKIVSLNIRQEQNTINIKLESLRAMGEIIIMTEYKTPLINKENPGSTTITGEQIDKMR